MFSETAPVSLPGQDGEDSGKLTENALFRAGAGHSQHMGLNGKVHTCMIKLIFEESKTDALLSRLLEDAVEYARVYTLARRRQKGCDGMGELTTVREEFRDVVDKMMKYLQEKKNISQDVSYDIDSVADEIVRQEDPL